MTAKTLLSHSFRIAWKDLTELFRNRLGLVLLVVMPLFMMVMVGFIYPSGGATLNNLPVGLVNEDDGFNGSTVPSQSFIMGLRTFNAQTNMLKLNDVATLDDIKAMVQRGELNGGIVIPANFSECIMTGQQGTLIIVTDQSNPTIYWTRQDTRTYCKATMPSEGGIVGEFPKKKRWKSWGCRTLSCNLASLSSFGRSKPFLSLLSRTQSSC